MTEWRFALEKAAPREVSRWQPRQEQEGETPMPPADSRFEAVVLPHDWAIGMPFSKTMEEGATQGYRDRWGIGWYRRELVLEEKKPGWLYYLDFGGIYENSTVWVNGKWAGGCLYGYRSFRLDVTEYLVIGANEILIRVDNTLCPVDRWYSGCGIYRTVKLLEVEEKHLDPWEVKVETALQGEDARVTVHTGVQDKVRATLWQPVGESGARRLSVAEGFSENGGGISLSVPRARVWSAQDPYLYELELTLYEGERACDQIQLSVGIREVVFVSGKGMLVNGKKELLRGVCLHQDVGCRGIAAKKEIWRERLTLLKEMGCNAVRPTHHVFSEEFLELCDEMGFYVYEECFDKWRYGLYERYFESQWQLDMDAMIKRDRNHPCIVIWGVGNEETNQGQAAMLADLKMLCDYARTLDQTRPITYATKPLYVRDRADGNPSGADDIWDYLVYDREERLAYTKKVAELVDILCCNYQEQWYEQIHELLPDKLILGTEVYPFFQGRPEFMQNYSVDIPSLVPETLDYCIGSMIWTGIDYLGESTGYPAKGRCNAMIRTNGQKRPMFYVLQSYWTQDPMVHFSVMDYSLPDEGMKLHWSMPPYVDHWHFPQFHRTVIPYMIASNCEEVRLYLNGREFGLPRPSACENRMITGFLPYQAGCVKVVGLQDGKEVCCQETYTPGPAVKLTFDTPFRSVPAQEGYEVLLTVRAADEQGHSCFRESAPVRFRVESPCGSNGGLMGQILGVDNGDLMGSESWQEDFIHLHQGQASVMIRLTEGTGRVSVYAEGAGLLSAQAVIVAERKE